MLESMLHVQSSFVTLTVEDQSQTDVVPRDLCLWLKRLRLDHDDKPLRYYAIGEYGDRGGRPHYHAAVFGLAPCITGSAARFLAGGQCPCPSCALVRKSWTHGFSMVGSLSPQSASYIAGYVTKKMVRPLVPGRAPEFQRMSLKPGLGAGAMPFVEDVLRRYKKTVPTHLKQGSTARPLGRYLRSRLAKSLGVKLDSSFVDERLRLVRAYAFENARSVQEVWFECARPAAIQQENLERAKRLTL